MIGADSIKVSDDLTIWEERGWNTQAGIVVVVGVKKPVANTPYRLLLTSN